MKVVVKRIYKQSIHKTKELDLKHSKNEKVHEIFKKMKNIKISFLNSFKNEQISARPMTTFFKDEDYSNIYFISPTDSDQIDDFKSTPTATATLSDLSDNIYVECQGHISLTQSKEKIEPFWNEMTEAWFPKGITESDVTLVRLEIANIECWDSSGSTLYKAINLITSRLTNTKPDFGNKEQVSLKN